ncbi:MAG TPA: phosphatidylglycerophosphatase A [Vicinamibacterales bacterium]|nr:phosphatidylglycerophosphatase A [Vicinamibacterales bacterium]
MKALAIFIASFGYVGFFPIAPGTAGSLAALLLFAFIRWIGVAQIELLAIVAVFAIGVWAAQGTEVALARKDPGVVVIDEVLGMLITLALLPVSMPGIALGFLFFRVLDVTKPYPAAQLEHLHGGLGIMADDAVAGLYAHIALRVCVWMVPAWLLA